MLLGHLALLAGLAGLNGPPAGGRPAASDRVTARADRPADSARVQVQVRLQPLAEAPGADRDAGAAAPVVPPAQASAPPPGVAPASPAAEDPGATASAAAAGPEASGDATATAEAPADAVRDAAPTLLQVGPGGPGGPDVPEEEYLPRSALSLAPEALGEVLLAYPPEAPPGRYGGVLTLFIDADGQVRRVRREAARAGEPELPPAFEEAARQAFLAARFRPGERDGRPVKARIRIAVEFEAQAAPPAVEERGLR